MKGKIAGLILALAALVIIATACEKQKSVELLLLSPNGEEKWTTGSVYNIAWKASGFKKVVLQAIDYSCSSELAMPIATGIPASQRNYAWKIPDDFFESTADIYCAPYYGWKPGDDFKIFVAEWKTDGTYGIQDQSDDYFNLVMPAPTAVIQLAADNPRAIRPGTQVPLMRFEVTAPSTDIVLKEIYFGFFYDAGGAAASAENFTLWKGPTLVSQGDNLNPPVKFSQFSVMVPANSSVVLEVRGDITGPDGATMQMSLDQSSPSVRGLPLNTSLNVLRP